MSKKSNLTALIGASLAGLAAAVYISHSQGSWPFASKQNEGEETDSDSPAAGSASPKEATPNSAAAAKGKSAPVDVALTNEVASYTEHNPNNAGDFTDDGATGNAD
ncbi:thioredoxin reductase [Hymenobacter luteus]|uniref:Thioredoxin reductase n=2 Tax=Hymenobacter TaxID=89966 RepID=A0A7W9T3C2_9BACT|nr:MULTISPECIES: hypothetical protein [Hymenobacter]MBB4602935.1 thioredoxin reductase [Hymenobacter latericoloratus]MBB6060827.1 thioredoxin reductase [Hymenobacter luteus]